MHFALNLQRCRSPHTFFLPCSSATHDRVPDHATSTLTTLSTSAAGLLVVHPQSIVSTVRLVMQLHSLLFIYDCVLIHNNFLRVRPRSSGEHCLNSNTGVCGKSPSHNYETSAWLDRNGDPMPWIAQGTYQEGGTMKVDSYLDTHHNGHMGELFALIITYYVFCGYELKICDFDVQSVPVKRDPRLRHRRCRSRELHNSRGV